MTILYLNEILGAGAIALLLFALWIHRSEAYPNASLIDIVTSKDGHIDRSAIMEFIAFLVMTWGFIVLINLDKLSEWYAGVYVGAFVLRGVYTSYLKSQNGKTEVK